jgi:hypothetical protein
MYVETHPHEHVRLTRLIRLSQDDAEPLETSFELNDTLFAKANIEKVNEVYLWLGVRTILIQSSGPASHFPDHAPDEQTPNVYLSILTTSPGQRHAFLPNPRSRRAAVKQAERRTAKSEQLRGRPRFPARASDRTCNNFFYFSTRSPIRIAPTQLWLSSLPAANGSPSQTMEVATARVYNWDISQKRKEEKEAGGSS